ncbi:MAG: NAD(P)/FAD-dependent oxidoreductase [Lachnospiraceae bacterium]|nr:NAD(P)/FAD-dependent oxidoreductase [Lachnospiraceae bacterium]
MKQVLVIGGGASGLMAAIAAAENGAKVTLIEKNKTVGKKLLVTGNGRCNFTNLYQHPESYRGGDPAFTAQALAAFSAKDAVRFFERLGIGVKEREGWLYPASGQASSIASVLRLEAERLRVKLACNTTIKEIERKNSHFLAKTDSWTYEGDALVLACGSKAAPETGSDGDGYRFAEALGHSVTGPFPALTGLVVAEQDCGKLAGVRAEALVTLRVGSEEYQDTGEVQFTSYGLSGIPVFQVSRYASAALAEGKSCEIQLDFWPELPGVEMERMLTERMHSLPNRCGAELLLGVFPEKLSRYFLERAGISTQKCGARWTEKESLVLALQIRRLGFHVVKSLGFDHAQVCAGGVPLGELKGISMESSFTPGLYLAGELLDVDGACGGYNLQWAWTSGYLAGRAAAEEKGKS